MSFKHELLCGSCVEMQNVLLIYYDYGGGAISINAAEHCNITPQNTSSTKKKNTSMSILSKQFEGTVSKTPPGDIADNSECKYSPDSLVQGNFFYCIMAGPHTKSCQLRLCSPVISSKRSWQLLTTNDQF